MCDFNKYLHYSPQAAAPQLAHIILPNAQLKNMMTYEKLMMAVVSSFEQCKLCLQCSNEIPQENHFYCNNISCQEMETELADMINDIKEINVLSTVRKICIKCKLQKTLEENLFCIQCLITLRQLVAKYQKKRENLLKELHSDSEHCAPFTIKKRWGPSL